MTDNPLNAQQLNQMQRDFNDQLKRIVENIGLRKWAVEQAFSASRVGVNLPPGEGYVSGSPVTTVPYYPDPMALAEAIYDFVSQPAAGGVKAE
jgi:hypothetical protein